MSDFQSFLNVYIVFVFPTFSSQDVFNVSLLYSSLNTIVVFLIQYISYEFVRTIGPFLRRSSSLISRKIESTSWELQRRGAKAHFGEGGN